MDVFILMLSYIVLEYYKCCAILFESKILNTHLAFKKKGLAVASATLLFSKKEDGLNVLAKYFHFYVGQSSVFNVYM
jgi:hypothetical protein